MMIRYMKMLEKHLSSSPQGERIEVRGEVIIIATLTPALSRQRERGKGR
jgi:hypothetical protein